MYKRCGKALFTTNKTGEGWDDKLNGIKQRIGAYIWICRVKDYNGKIVEKKETLLLIR
jgi:hypothetical protein